MATLNLFGPWELKYEATLEALPASPSSYYPIPTLAIPSDFSGYLTIRAGSTKAKLSWRLAFHATALVEIPAVGIAQLERFYCPLGTRLLNLRDDVPFRLQLDFPHWQQEISIEIWQQTS